jgi:trimethylamine--corrinoid protein Co-methyltransferase
MRSDYVYPEIADRRSIGEWEKSGSRDARELARERTRTILAQHYPRHVSAMTDAAIRVHYNIILPAERMRAGNGVW